MVVDQNALGELQTQIASLQAADLERATDGLGQPSFQLTARQVDAYSNARQPLVLPGPVLQTGALQNPLSHGNDQPILLCNRDELGWKEQPELGVLPAQQGLRRDDGIGIGINDRLIVHLELVALERS